MSRVLIDTNIFVYGIDEDSKYYDQAKKMLWKDDGYNLEDEYGNKFNSKY
tara:strand:+ start:1007 stop:1156 length:150 start_codon:yes stop_codon:yes gene_type:complete